MATITQEQKTEIIKLYQGQKHTLKQILKKTGIRSEQTIYRILEKEGISLKGKRTIVKRVTITLDKKAWELIKQTKPKNLSKWVCEMIEKGSQKQ